MRNIISDIFLSYRTSDGTQLTRALSNHLKSQNYGVYFNPDEQKDLDFVREVKDAIIRCKDFIIIFTNGYRQRLLNCSENPTIYQEIKTAKEQEKNVIGLIPEGVDPPSEEEKWPEDIKEYICHIPYILVSNDFQLFITRPADKMFSKITSLPEGNDIYRNAFNNNPDYNVYDDVQRQMKAALEGNIEAMYEYANMCFYGFASDGNTSQKNMSEAYKYLSKLAETDNKYTDYAVNMIGHMFYSGTVSPGGDQSYEESLKRHLSCKDRLFEAATHSAYMLSIGSGCDFDYDKTVEFYKSVINNGDTGVIFNFANFYLKYGKFKEAAELYRSISEESTEALVELGKMYKLGVLSDPPKPDYFKAKDYFVNAINNGDCGPEPYYELGTMYFNPTGGFKKNFERACEYFTKAAEMKHKDSQYILGYMYDNGHVGRNVKKAIYYHEKAAEQGHVQSMEALALLYQQPECVNYHKAFRYAKMASKSNRCMGMFFYANLLFFGRGCEADMDKAYRYYKKAYDHGFIQAKFMMDKIERISKDKEA